ncbi:flagellar hook-associated protein FlgL [Tepidibacillus infernus]|uniref:Flagellar biosynthesis protein FlgL n=2 Tax=Tepidibacillus TaxID=1494427 RepID=A0A135L834_9BACI|nr:flagellar hook-associated protein FlgL [Tepidibacillus decaturensis]KXG45083.1 flagellar biosynthesis protein FlgL [Tepidibacillus decaturensis]
MRVTQGMLNSQMLRNLNNNLTRLEKLQNQMSTGKVINKPSDDPVGLGFALRYRSELASNEQYQRNVDSAISWLEYGDKMINEANDVLQRARELAVQGANGATPVQAMQALGQEVNQLYEQLVQIGNSQFNGKYVFNGQMTDVKPYAVGTAETVTPDAGVIQFEVGIGTIIPVNISGADLFGDQNDPTNAFKVLADLRDALNNNDQQGVSQSLGQLDSRLDLIMEKWAEIGARSNRIDLMKNRLENTNINLQELLSKTEDADMAELLINMKTEENIYQASLSTGARIIRPSLIDFLR